MNWDELQADFRGAGEPIGPDDLRRFKRRQVLKMAPEFAAGAALVAFYAKVLYERPSAPLLALAILSVLFTGVWLTYLVTNRSQLLRASAVDAQAWRELLCKRVAADLRVNRFLGRFIAGAVIFGLVWGPWMVATHWAVYSAEPWRAVLGFGVYYVVLLGLWMFQRRARRRLQEQQRALT